jgi:hypothetical protein
MPIPVVLTALHYPTTTTPLLRFGSSTGTGAAQQAAALRSLPFAHHNIIVISVTARILAVRCPRFETPEHLFYLLLLRKYPVVRRTRLFLDRLRHWFAHVVESRVTRTMHASASMTWMATNSRGKKRMCMRDVKNKLVWTQLLAKRLMQYQKYSIQTQTILRTACF